MLITNLEGYNGSLELRIIDTPYINSQVVVLEFKCYETLLLDVISVEEDKNIISIMPPLKEPHIYREQVVVGHVPAHAQLEIIEVVRNNFLFMLEDMLSMTETETLERVGDFSEDMLKLLAVYRKDWDAFNLWMRLI